MSGSRSFPFKLVVFDLDGTLVDSLADIAASVNHALAAHGLPTHPLGAFNDLIGEGLEVLIERALPPGRAQAGEGRALVASLITAYRAHHAMHHLDTTRPYPQIPALLGELGERSVPLAVLSNKREDFVRKVVRGALPGVPFARVRGTRDGVPRKPDPTAALAIARELGVAPGRAAFVGDTKIDMQTAAAAGMFPVGVSWGFREVRELVEHGARAVLREPLELLRVGGE